MQHLEEGEIHAWLDGALSEAEGARIEQHAATCTECAAMVADARGLIAGAARIVSALDHVPSGVIPKSGNAATASRPLWRALRLTPFRAAMAASLIVAAGSLIVVQRKDGELMVPSADQIAMPMVASAPAPAAPPADVKAERIDAAAANEARQSQKGSSRSAEQSVSKTTLALKDTGLLLKPDAPSAAPAPKVASAEDQRAKKERDSVVANAVVATAAPASAAGAGARGGVRGQTAAQGQVGAQAQTGARQPALDSARATADIALRRALPPAVQRAEATSGFAGVAPNFLGCYQVVDSTAWPRALPVRFAITADSARVRLVRPGVDQRPVIGRWQTSSPSSAAITLDGASTPSFTLTQMGIEVVATTPSAPTVRVRLLRPGCAL
jgi:hypothetical protein